MNTKYEGEGEKLLLTVADAAAMLSLSRSRLYELMVNGGDDYLPSIKIGRARRIPVEALRAWVDQQRVRQEQPSYPTPRLVRVA